MGKRLKERLRASGDLREKTNAESSRRRSEERFSAPLCCCLSSGDGDGDGDGDGELELVLVHLRERKKERKKEREREREREREKERERVFWKCVEKRKYEKTI
jgi:hypothetical protein